MGNTCKPMAVLFQCMTKFTTNKKKKKKKNVLYLWNSSSIYRVVRKEIRAVRRPIKSAKFCKAIIVQLKNKLKTRKDSKIETNKQTKKWKIKPFTATHDRSLIPWRTSGKWYETNSSEYFIEGAVLGCISASTLEGCQLEFLLGGYWLLRISGFLYKKVAQQSPILRMG